MTRRLLQILNEVSLGWMLATLAVVIIAFGVGYFALEYVGEGIEFTYGATRQPSLGDALYFSLVTISSLGYGDLRPVGLSRLLVGAEVIIGLSFFGLIVAKVASVRQDYILKRIYTDKVESEVGRYVSDLHESRDIYRTTSGLLLNGELDPAHTTTFRGSVTEATLFYRLRQLATSMRDMMAFEVHNRALFGFVPDSTISEMYAGWQDVFDYTMSLWQETPEASCELVLCGNSGLIAETIVPVREMARMGLKESRCPDIQAQCRSLLELSDQMQAEVLPEVRTKEDGWSVAVPHSNAGGGFGARTDAPRDGWPGS